MISKRNIAIYFGLLLALMSVCTSTAAAAEVEVDVTVSPDNLAIDIGDPTGTKKPQFMAIEIDNMANENINYDVRWIDLSTIVICVSNGTAVNTVGYNDRKEDPEINDTDLILSEEYPDEMILMYERSKLFGDLDLDNTDSLLFTVTGEFLSDDEVSNNLAGKSFEGTYTVSLKHITKEGGEKPESPGNGGDKPDKPSNGGGNPNKH